MPKGRTKSPKKPKKVPYARGFKPRTRAQSLTALGAIEPSDHIACDLARFEAIPAPTDQNDWLAQYKEEGQSYEDFLVQTPWLSDRKIKGFSDPFVASGQNLKEKYPSGKIYLVMLGDFDALAPRVEDLVEYIELFLCLDVAMLPAISLVMDGPSVVAQGRVSGKRSLDNRFDKDTGCRQLAIGSLLAFLKKECPSDAICTLALTACDLYDTDPDLFVAGMAAGNMRVGAFSIHRYGM